MRTKKYDWKQSTFCPNCPIYYVNGTGDGSTLMKIEYHIMNKNPDWSIEVLNGFEMARMDGNMDDVIKVKAVAEKLLKRTLKYLAK